MLNDWNEVIDDEEEEKQTEGDVEIKISVPNIDEEENEDQHVRYQGLSYGNGKSTYVRRGGYRGRGDHQQFQQSEHQVMAERNHKPEREPHRWTDDDRYKPEEHT